MGSLEVTKEILDRLSAFFPARSISWKPQTTTKDKTRCLAVAYIDARDVMRRLDAVCAGYWSFTWEPLPNTTAVKGRLAIGDTVREDAGEEGDGPAGESIKAAVSDALKRCAVHYGVGRYLYYLPAQWVAYDEANKRITEEPKVPDWALPEDEKGKAPQEQKSPEAAKADVKTQTPQPKKANGDTKSAAAQAAQPKAMRPADPETVKRWIGTKALSGGKDAPSEGQRGLTTGVLNDLFPGIDADMKTAKRHSLLMFLFGKDSSKSLTSGECSALIFWASDLNDNGNHVPNEHAVKEATAIVAAYEQSKGQAALDLGAGQRQAVA